jgi:hypothetical protein
MTDTAGRNVTLRGFRSRAVALVARKMSVESHRNRHSYAAATGSMTSNATNAAHFHVTRMVESHVETAETRKGLQRSRLGIAVTDRAYRILRISKLLYMAAGAR